MPCADSANATAGQQLNVGRIGLANTENFGDGSADLLWQSSSGEVDYWTLQGTAVTGMHVLANPGPNWHPVG